MKRRHLGLVDIGVGNGERVAAAEGALPERGVFCARTLSSDGDVVLYAVDDRSREIARVPVTADRQYGEVLEALWALVDVASKQRPRPQLA